MAPPLLRDYQSCCMENGAEISTHILSILENNRSESLQLPPASAGKVCSHDLDMLLQTILRHDRLDSLGLSSHALSKAHVELVAKIISDRCCPETLLLEGCELGASDVRRIAATLQGNVRLRRLSLRGNEAGDAGGEQLAEALRRNDTLESLDCSRSRLRGRALIGLSAALAGNRALRSLDLSAPASGHEQQTACQHLARALTLNCGLNELVLRHCGITDDGVLFLLDGLREHRTLQFLDLSCNKIGRAGSGALGELIRLETPLQSLNVAHNQLDDDGFSHLAAALRCSGQLLQLVVCSNSAGDSGLRDLAQSLTTNSTLRRIFIWGNRIGRAAAMALDLLLSRGRISLDDADFRTYAVDGEVSVARTDNEPATWRCRRLLDDERALEERRRSHAALDEAL